MGRIRTIKPEFPQSESMGRVSRDARLTLINLLTISDDSGRLRGNPRMLASLLFPYDEDSKSLIGGWLEELDKEGCIIRYSIDNNQYIQICNFISHQRIDKPTPSKIPEFDESSKNHRRILQGYSNSPPDGIGMEGIVSGKDQEFTATEKNEPSTAFGETNFDDQPESGPDSSKTGKPKKTPDQQAIFDIYWDGLITNTDTKLTLQQRGIQAKACWQLVDRTELQFNGKSQESAKNIIEIFFNLKKSDSSKSGFWKMQPSTPLALAGQSIWGQIMEAFKNGIPKSNNQFSGENYDKGEISTEVRF